MNTHQEVGKQVFPVVKSESDHRTPEDLFKHLSDEVGGFDLDAAASDENHLVEHYFTLKDNSLFQPWQGVVWCNPPYNNAARFMEKAVNEVNAKRASIVWLLVPVRSCTKWFHEIIMPNATEIRLIKGRLKFGGPHQIGAAPFPSMLVRFGGEPAMPRIVAADRQGMVL